MSVLHERSRSVPELVQEGSEVLRIGGYSFLSYSEMGCRPHPASSWSSLHGLLVEGLSQGITIVSTNVRVDAQVSLAESESNRKEKGANI